MRKLVTIFSIITFAAGVTACNNDNTTCATYASENRGKIKKTEVTVQVEKDDQEVDG